MRWRMRGSKEFLKAFVCAAFFMPIIMLGLWIHEMGHVAIILMFGGQVLDMGIEMNGGYVIFNGVGTELYWIIGLAGGSLCAIYYGFLASKITKGLYIPAIFSLIYAVFEMIWAMDHTDILYSNMGVASMFMVNSVFLVLYLNVCIELIRMKPNLRKLFIKISDRIREG